VLYLIVTAEDKYMLSTNNINGYDRIRRERQVIELYKQGKNTRYIAKELILASKEAAITPALIIISNIL
jgi:DNA-binding NarL/FixJ family response regulator